MEMASTESDHGEGVLVILQSLICLLREKNVLTRSDIEELCDRVATRAADAAHDPMPCRREATRTAAAEMTRITEYTGRRYGGKHRPHR